MLLFPGAVIYLLPVVDVHYMLSHIHLFETAMASCPMFEAFWQGQLITGAGIHSLPVAEMQDIVCQLPALFCPCESCCL